MFTTNSTVSVINITKAELDITMIRKFLEICVLYKQFNIHSQQSLLNYFIVIPMCLYFLNNVVEILLDMEPSKRYEGLTRYEEKLYINHSFRNVRYLCN